MLLLTAFIWGTAFVAQSVGMDYLEPFTFNGVRCLIGAIALLPCIWFFNRGKEKENKVNDENEKRDLIKGGIACGILLFAASSLQQIGLVYTAAGKAGFITAFYIVLVPVFGIFLHKNIGVQYTCPFLLNLKSCCSFQIRKEDLCLGSCLLRLHPAGTPPQLLADKFRHEKSPSSFS